MNTEMSVAGRIAILAIQLGLVIIAARFCGRLVRRIGVPPVLGELLAGILIGPYLLGSVGLGIPGFENGLFPLAAGEGGLPVSLVLYALATLGSIMLLFMSGLETDLRMFFRYSVVGTVVGLGGVIFSFAFGAGLGMICFHASVWDPRCLFMGILSTATSVGITARILSEKKCIDSPEGTTILAAAVIDDVLGIICLAVVMGIVGAAGGEAVNWGNIGWITFKSIGIWLGATAAGLLLAHRIAGCLKKFDKSSAVFAMLAFALALLLAGVFEEAGLAMIVGAYVMGLSLSKTDISFSVQRTLRGVYDFLVPVFFVVMGMLVDVRVLGDAEVLKMGLIFSILAILAKIIGCALPAFFMNFNGLGALRIGVGMIPRGEVALIIAGIGATTMMTLNGVKVPIIDSRLFGVAIIMTLATTLIAPPALAFVLAMRGRGVRRETVSADTVHIRYDVPAESIAEFLLRLLIDNFRREGFRHSEIDRDGGLTHFRRENETFTLQTQGCHFDFEANPPELPLIRTVVYETLVDLYRTVGDLKQLTLPENFSTVMSAENGAAVQTAHGLRLGELGRIIPAGCVLVDLKAGSQREAILELLHLLDDHRQLADVGRCQKDVLEREAVVSTCLEAGVAFPHARTDGVKQLVAAVGISRQGYRELGDAGDSIYVVCLSLCPFEEDKPYLRFVSRMAARLRMPEAVESLKNCRNEIAVRDFLAAVPAEPRRG